LAIGENSGTKFAFVAGVESIDVFRDAQKVHSIKPPFTPSAVTTDGTLVAVGGEVGPCFNFYYYHIH
jgi:hypothetical protein